VTLLLEWPKYSRTQTALLGHYVIDDTLPLLELKFTGTKIIDDMPVFNQKLGIIPHMLIRKPLSHWRLSFYTESGTHVGGIDGTENLPERFTWAGHDELHEKVADGIYEVRIEVWDLAGNSAKASKLVSLNNAWPQVDMAVDMTDEDIVVGLKHKGKVPLEFWRLDLWTNEGKVLTQAEGTELPAKIDVELPDDEDLEIEGFLFYRDILGLQQRKKIETLLNKKVKPPEVKEEPAGISKKWVDEF